MTDETSSSEMNATQANEFLEKIINEKAELKSEYLDLALRFKLFDKAKFLLQNKITSENFIPMISSILESESDINDEFYSMILYSIINGEEFSSIIENNNKINPTNINAAMLIIMPYLLKGGNQEIFNDNQLIKSLLESSENTITYKIISKDIENQLQFINNELQNFGDSKQKLTSSAFGQRINELSNAAKVTIKMLSNANDKTSIDRFKSQFTSKVNEIENYILKNLDEPSKQYQSIIEKINFLKEQIKEIKESSQKIINSYINPFLNDKNKENATNVINMIKDTCIQDQKESFINKFYYIFASFVFSSLQLFLEDQTEKTTEMFRLFSEEFNGIDEKIQNNSAAFKSSIIEADEIAKAIESGPVSKASQKASNTLLFAIHFSECSLLDSMIKVEAINNCNNSSFYPCQFSTVFKDSITKGARSQSEFLKSQKSELYGLVNDRVQSFFTKMHHIPGIISSIDYTNFSPEEKWKWPSISGTYFPSAPCEVRNVLLSRFRIEEMLKQSQISHTEHKCKKCQQNEAFVVCPECKQLVLCEKCKNETHKCPNDGCNVTFD